MNKRSQIVSKQIVDSFLLPQHIPVSTINYILSHKKLGIARIAQNINVQPGDNEIDITDYIYNNSFNSHITLHGKNNGVLLSGLGQRNLIVNGKIQIKGECLYNGIKFDYDENPFSGGYQGQKIGRGDGQSLAYKVNLIKYPVLKGSVKISIKSNGANQIVEDNENGNLIGFVSPNYGYERMNYIDYTTGELAVMFTAPPDFNTDIIVDYKYTSYENYKVLIRDSKSRQPLFNISFGSGEESAFYKGEIFGELIAEEFYPSNILLGTKGYIQINVGEDYAIGNQSIEEWEGFEESGIKFETIGSILCGWNGTSENSDVSIGKVININSNLLYLDKKSKTNYAGDCKFVRYKLRFYYYNSFWEPIPFYFYSPATIDCLFIEAYDLSFSDINNIYNYLNFYKLGDIMANYMPSKIEDRILDENVVGGNESGDFFKLPNWEYEVPYLEIQVSNKEYQPGSLEVYVDGVRIFHYKENDNIDDMRIIETDPANGKFVITNMYYEDFYKREPMFPGEETGTKQVYAIYSLSSELESGSDSGS